MHTVMTHYMELLATNQPWNLIFFMAILVILAEFIAVSELFILLNRKTSGTLRTLNRGAGILAGFYFSGVVVYLLFNAVIPVTQQGAWRGIGDVIAVGFYLLGVVPLLGIALMELGVIGKQANEAACDAGGVFPRGGSRRHDLWHAEPRSVDGALV